MAILTIRELPDDLQEFLKADAAANHRSMNKQVIVALDEYRRLKLNGQKPKLTAQERLARVREIQAAVQREMNHDPRTADEIIGYDENGLFK